MLKQLSVLSCALMLCSCTSYLSDYERQDMPYVSSYAGAKAYTGSVISENFWQSFQDHKLDALMTQALLNNYDMRTAAVNVQKALLAVDISGTSRHPTANASIGTTAQRALDYHDSTQKKSSTSLGFSYQVDLFGKIEAQNLQAVEAFNATAYDYWAMRLTIINSLSEAYWQYAYAKEAVKLATEDLADSQKRLSLVQSMFSAGAASEVDVSDANINHIKVERTLEAKHLELKKARTALATLLGTTADHDFEVGALDDAKIPSFSLDIPAKLLARRPDLMAKEATLKKYYAAYDEAKLSWFPDFTLSTTLSLGAATFGRFLSDPIGALGAAITLPFLNFNQLIYEQKSALKDVEIADLDFVSTYIKAVQEVYDAVSSIDYYRKEVINTKAQYDLASRSYDLYQVRYSSGLVSLKDFLDAADAKRSSRLSHLEAKRNNLQATMALMIALGGDTEIKTADNQ
jgi:NodT family efflux transporter outer membrane factor (OMF) lipoprotein